MKGEIQFANEKVKQAFEELQLEDNQLRKFIERAFEDIKNNPFCGIQVPKRLIPQEYIKKFNIKNVWKYNLPGAWKKFRSF